MNTIDSKKIFLILMCVGVLRILTIDNVAASPGDHVSRRSASALAPGTNQHGQICLLEEKWCWEETHPRHRGRCQ